MIPSGRSPDYSNLHVLTITPFYPRAGDESGGCFVAEPLVELAKLGIHVSVLAVDPWYRTKGKPTASAPEATWYRYPSLPGGMGLAGAGAGLYLRLRGPVQKLHARSRIDLIHAHGALPCGHAASLLSRDLKIPYVVSVHGLDAFSSRQVGGRRGAKCARRSREVYRRAARVLAVSQRVADAVREGTGEGCTLSVVHNGVDPTLFAAGEEPPTPVLLTVGNLIPTKGHELIAEAVGALREEYSNLTWEVIGDGPELNTIRRRLEELGIRDRAQFRGRQNRAEVAAACRRCSVFVLPSRYEGLGCVYLEAMACAKVALGCSGQGIEDIIRHGRNGWLVAPDGREELIQGLRCLLSDAELRARIGAAARSTILESCTWQLQAMRLANIYREIIA